MKKTIIILIMFFLYINNINAETYYGQYKKVDEINNYLEDTFKIETLKLYNTYQNKYVDMGYMLENEEYLKDENDFIEEYTDINEEEIGDEYITIKTKSNNKSYSLQIISENESIKISELEIFSKDNKLYYEFYKDLEGITKKITDKDMSTYVEFKENYSYYINFYNSHLVKDIKINIYTEETEDKDIYINLNGTKANVKLFKNKNKYTITFDDNEELEEDVIYKYKGNKKIYKYYKEEKEPLNNFILYGENILLDDFIELDEYYVREKLVLQDNIIINNETQKPEDFIEYSTNNVNINCNIDYNLNNKYFCEYILNDIYVLKEVLVDIPNKEIKEEKIYNINFLNTNEENIIIDEVKVTKNINEDKINIVKETKNINEEKNNTIYKSKIIRIVKYIIFINLVIIEIILFIKKNKK